MAGAHLRSHCTNRCTETRAKKSYKPINGDAKDRESIGESTESVEINHYNYALLKDKENYKDYQTIK